MEYRVNNNGAVEKQSKVRSNSSLFTDTYTSLLRARHGAAKREG